MGSPHQPNIDPRRQWLRAKRLAREITQASVANHLGVRPAQVHRWECGAAIEPHTYVKWALFVGATQAEVAKDLGLPAQT